MLKDLFQRDHPSLLDELTGGAKIVESLNVELPKILERRVDLVFRLADSGVFHIEFQVGNDRDMPYRSGIYCLLLAQRYRCKVRQVVLYAGSARMRMRDHLDLGDTRVAYRLIDLRQFAAGSLLSSGRPGDLVLAMLASDGTARLQEILQSVCRLDDAERARALSQLGILSGLRGSWERLKMELTKMGSATIDIQKNAFLREISENAKAEGRTEGRTEGMAKVLRKVLESKFGPLPKWAAERIATARVPQMERWSRKVVKAQTLEAVLGRR